MCRSALPQRNSMADRPLKKLRVFVLEDEVLVAMLLEDMLRDIGCVVAGLAITVDEGLAHVASVEADIAVLDVNVGGAESFAIAEGFAARGIPIVFSTGYAEADLPERWRDWPRMAKPYTVADLAAALTVALDGPPAHQPA